MKASLLALAALCILAAPTLAREARDLTLGLGVAHVSPKDGIGTLAGAVADVGNNTRPSVTLEYFIKANVGLDHAVSDNGALRCDLLHTDIDSDATLNGAPIGRVEIDPLATGVSYAMNF